MSTLDRRQLLQLCAGGVLGLAVGAGPLGALSRGRSSLPIQLGVLESFPLGTAHLFSDRGLLLLRSTEGLAFISTRCTHLGCPLRLVGQELQCACHGGRYTLEGRVLDGPPPSPLGWVGGGVSSSGMVYVDLALENVERRYTPV